MHLQDLKTHLISTIAQTNGLALMDTLSLLLSNVDLSEEQKLELRSFVGLINQFQANEVPISRLFEHSVAKILFAFFKEFPLRYCEEHIHLTGSLSPEFIWEHLQKILQGDEAERIQQKIEEVYGRKIVWKGVETVRELVCLGEQGDFTSYLRMLFLPKLILTSRAMHKKAAWHMAQDLYQNYNVGSIRLKFTFSRLTAIKEEQIPGLQNLTEEDVVMGLYEGFRDYQKENPDFKFVLAPSFRKEEEFYDQQNFASYKEHFDSQVQKILDLLAKYPELKPVLCEVDTVGDEKNLYKKSDFERMRAGFRKLQYKGFHVKSHHGETWHILRKGIQAVDNAMNIWHIQTLEHGLSLGINPNYYFQVLLQEVLELNAQAKPITDSLHLRELEDMRHLPRQILENLKQGKVLTKEQKTVLTKVKFHQAREIEHYQHDVLNRMINKKLGLVALPSSNLKLTGALFDHKDHPFSWWEKKGVRLGIGTDNYITLQTNFIAEMMILLFAEAQNLKITKLLIVATKQKNRAVISNSLWEMHKIL